jgi:MerR family transcriptional regulator, thiopeptide resistance regulator
MMTVTRLARRFGLSRGALLYYESIGLLRPAVRSEGNYRCYAEKDAKRLEQICVYRDAGLKLEDIQELLDGPGSAAARVLERRMSELHVEIELLRGHQRAIARLLQHKGRMKAMTKEKWVGIMRAAGFSEDDMRRWHREFERASGAEHQEFLEYLQIGAGEIAAIREWSRKE